MRVRKRVLYEAACLISIGYPKGLFHNNTALEAPPAEDAQQITVKRPSMARTKLNEILLDVKREASKFLSEPITVPKTEKTGQYSLSSKVWYVYKKQSYPSYAPNLFFCFPGIAMQIIRLSSNTG